jgi:hypothetical protein
MEPGKIRAAVRALGWSKATYLVCVVLLVRGVVTFEQGIMLILIALLIDCLPDKGELLPKAKSTSMPRRQGRLTGRDESGR